MENFWRRLRYYGIGFGMGLIFVFFFFKNRGCSWLPSNRVKNAILERLIVVNPETQKQLEADGVTMKDLVEVLNDGDVVFENSDKDEDSKVYEIDKDGVKYAFTLPEESFISQVFVGVDAKKVKTGTSGLAKVIFWPNDSTMVHCDLEPQVLCQRKELGFEKDVDFQKYLEENAWINLSKSNLSIKPKPEHYIEFTNENDTIGVLANWYMYKINITSFINSKSTCKE